MGKHKRLTVKRSRHWLAGLLVLVLLGVLYLGCSRQPTAPDWEGPPGMLLWEAATASQIADSAELLARGRQLYSVRCLTCHGSEGDGRGPASLFLGTPPRDFTSGNYKFRSTYQEGMPADMDLYRTITAGFPAYGMPSFRYLSNEDRWALVYYVKSFYPDWDEFGRPQVIAVSAQPPEDPQAVNRGKELYEDKFECITCHGPEGHGDGEQAHELRGQWDLPLSPRDFTKGPTFRKAGWRIQDTVRTIATGLPGTDMPSFAEQSTDPENFTDLWDVARYVEYLKAQAQGQEQ